MKLVLKKRTSNKVVSRLKNKIRIRRKVQGTAEKPRLAVFKSTKHIYAQLVDDVSGVTLASVSSLKSGKSGNKETAQNIGKEIAEKAKSLKIDSIVFDRSGYVYHGRVEAVASGAREAGLKF